MSELPADFSEMAGSEPSLVIGTIEATLIHIVPTVSGMSAQPTNLQTTNKQQGITVTLDDYDRPLFLSFY